ncbi:SRPBCC domain-containing protein [Mesorhizobium kowhaii]|uniref:SRPBCC family protein n=1 Tax=Mesorhizobium kowhaii TaxID=1300272 RepID=UPI0035E9F32A
MDSFTTTFTVDRNPEAAFAAITNARGWWSQEIEGRTDKTGAVFDYHYRDLHRCRIQVTELIPGKKVAWHVLENHFSFTHDKTEWTDTRIVFEITAKRDETGGGETEVRFTHVGLVPDYECYEACSQGWGTYINGSLRALILTGKGHPNVGEAMTESERALA